MSIANELSSEVAVWLLAERAALNPETANASSPKALRHIILELHTTLQRLKKEERAARRLSMLLSSNIKSSAANSH